MRDSLKKDEKRTMAHLIDDVPPVESRIPVADCSHPCQTCYVSLQNDVVELMALLQHISGGSNADSRSVITNILL